MLKTSQKLRSFDAPPTHLRLISHLLEKLYFVPLCYISQDVEKRMPQAVGYRQTLLFTLFI